MWGPPLKTPIVFPGRTGKKKESVRPPPFLNQHWGGLVACCKVGPPGKAPNVDGDIGALPHNLNPVVLGVYTWGGLFRIWGTQIWAPRMNEKKVFFFLVFFI